MEIRDSTPLELSILVWGVDYRRRYPTRWHLSVDEIKYRRYLALNLSILQRRRRTPPMIELVDHVPNSRPGDRL